MTSLPLHTSTNNHQPPSHSWKCNDKKTIHLSISFALEQYFRIKNKQTKEPQQQSIRESLPAFPRQSVCASARPSGREGWCPFPTWPPCGCARRSAAVEPSRPSCSPWCSSRSAKHSERQRKIDGTDEEKKKKKSLNPRTVQCSAKFSWRSSCDCTPYININKPAHAQQYNCVTQLPLPPHQIIHVEIFSAKRNITDALKHNMPDCF